MKRIRVDTDELKTKARDFEESAGSIARAGDEVLTVAMGLPSYEGQLSTPARAAGYEIQRRSREVQENLNRDAESLTKTAQAFESVDHQAIDGISQSKDLLFSPAALGIKGIDIGTSYLGYRDDGLSDTVILCMYGICRKIPRAGNEEAIAEFKNEVDDYERHKADMLAKFDALCTAALIALAGVIAVGAATAGLGTVIAAAGAIAAEAVVWKAVMAAQEAMAEDTYGAAYYWNKLFGETGLGEYVTGDDDQNPVDLQKRNDEEVYEP